MKLKKLILIALALVVIAGIAGYVVYTTPAKWKVDTTKLTQAFTAADAAVKADVEKAASSIKAGDFAGALASLGKAVDSGKLRDAEKQAITDALVDMQTIISEKNVPNLESLLETIGELNNKLL